jgi:large subunit ribosomal protein L24e
MKRSCSFCGGDIEPGTGKMYIKKDGTVFLFCSTKCQRNLLRLGRIPRWTPWTQTYRRARGLVPSEAAAELVVEEAPAVAEVAADVTIETPKGKDIPADLANLIDKRLGPDLSRGDIERFFAEFVGSDTFRNSIITWSRKAHAGKPVSRIEKAAFLAYKDSPEGRRVFKSWLDGQWQKVKGRREPGEEEEATAPKAQGRKGA